MPPYGLLRRFDLDCRQRPLRIGSLDGLEILVCRRLRCLKYAIHLKRRFSYRTARVDLNPALL